MVDLLGGLLEGIHSLVLVGRGLNTLDEFGQSLVGVHDDLGLVASLRLKDSLELFHGGCDRYGLLSGWADRDRTVLREKRGEDEVCTVSIRTFVVIWWKTYGAP